MRAAVVVFPGSNCDRDTWEALRLVTGHEPAWLWHAATALPPLDLIVLPGGFSYGDYLRTGAMATQAPVMRAVREAAAKGVRVLGICNGFQILCEAGLVPGALIRNKDLTFVCKPVALKVENATSDFTRRYRKGQTITLPIAHGEGNYTADAETLKRLEGEGRVAFRYAQNPNGSVHDIAGVLNEGGNVLGLMPHPERAIEPLHGNTDGAALFAGLVEAVG